MSEGFSRLAPLEFHKFLSYAKGSLQETRNHVTDGHESGYFSDQDHHRMVTLADRALGGTTRLMIYLDSPEAQRAYKEIRERRRKQQSRGNRQQLWKDGELEKRDAPNSEPENFEPERGRT